MSLELVKYQFRAMGGPCEVHLWLKKGADPFPVFSVLEAEVRRLEAKFSRYQTDSLLTKLNRGELNSVPLDDETSGLLNYADQCFKLSGQLFDPTVGILRKAWDFSSSILPNSDLLAALLPSVGWQKVRWDGVCVNLPSAMELDFGGIVKEFATDRLSIMLKQKRISGLINLAGDIAVSDKQPNGLPWNIAISHPRDDGAIATIELHSGAIAGSGDYERFMIVDGLRYGHILRPDTGFPATEGLSSVSVIADSCLIAGTVSTVAMLKGHQAEHWLNEMRLPFLAIDQSLKTFGSIEV